MCFPVNIAEFLILPILKNICKRLLFDFSMVHSYMDLTVQGLDCMTASGFRVRVTGLVFAFKQASLVLKQVPTCIRKHRQPLISQLSFYIGYFWTFQMVSDRFKWFQVVLRSFQIVSGCFSSFLTLASTSKSTIETPERGQRRSCLSAR